MSKAGAGIVSWSGPVSKRVDVELLAVPPPDSSGGGETRGGEYSGRDPISEESEPWTLEPTLASHGHGARTGAYSGKLRVEVNTLHDWFTSSDSDRSLDGLEEKIRDCLSKRFDEWLRSSLKLMKKHAPPLPQAVPAPASAPFSQKTGAKSEAMDAQIAYDKDEDEREMDEEEIRPGRPGPGKVKARPGKNVKKPMTLISVTDCILTRAKAFLSQLELDSDDEGEDVSVWDLRDGLRLRLAANTCGMLAEERRADLLLAMRALGESGRLLEERFLDRKLSILKRKRVVGITLSGAAIQASLMAKLAPAVMLVEEGAELLEPLLVAALPASLQHLIMIGDHEQLRPNVECYDLVQKFNFDRSMFERLAVGAPEDSDSDSEGDVKLRPGDAFPMVSLNRQSRMRPEFAKLLTDIYPHLESNTDIVNGHVVRFACMCLMSRGLCLSWEFAFSLSCHDIVQCAFILLRSLFLRSPQCMLVGPCTFGRTGTSRARPQCLETLFATRRRRTWWSRLCRRSCARACCPSISPSWPRTRAR